MENRYAISSHSAVLSSTFLVKMRLTSERSIVLETRVVNVSSQVSRNPRKIFTMYDRETRSISVFTSPDEILEEEGPVKKRLSTNRLGPAISRQFTDAGLLTLAVCSSAETAFLSGSNPPEISTSFFSFHPKHPATKVSKNMVVWIESFAPTEQDSIFGLRNTKFFVKIMTKMASGTMLKVFRVRNIGNSQPLNTVDYDAGEGRVYILRQNFLDVLNRLPPRPFPDVVEALISYENARSTNGIDHASETLVNYLHGRPSQFLWSMLQWSACFGDDDVMRILSVQIVTRVNNLIRNGIVAVQNDLGIEA